MRITLHNTVAAPTAAYQQPIRIDSAAFAGLINAKWSNGIAYYTANETPVYGWIEANATNTSADTLLWLKLAPIPGKGWVNVSIYFWPKSDSNLSATGYMGEAPELSSPYGEFDNGAKVFALYDDFAGPSLSPLWNVSGVWNYTVHDGFSLREVPGSCVAITSVATFAYGTTVDFYGDFFETTNSSAWSATGLGAAGCPARGNADVVGWGYGSTSGPTPVTQTGVSYTAGASYFSTQTLAVFTASGVSTAEADFEANYHSPQQLTTDIPNSPLSVLLVGSGNPSGALSSPQTTYWMRDRTYEATMPSVVAILPIYPINVTETGLPPGTGWWFNATSSPSGPLTSASVLLWEPNGTYPYSVATTDKRYAAAGGVLTVDGTAAVQTIPFQGVEFLAEFSETGLPAGTNWIVTVAGAMYATTREIIDVSLLNGSYSFSLGNIKGFAANRSSGSVTIHGQNVSESVAFSPTSAGSSPPTSTLLGLPPTEAYGLIGGLAVLVIAVGVAALWSGRRRARRVLADAPADHH